MNKIEINIAVKAEKVLRKKASLPTLVNNLVSGGSAFGDLSKSLLGSGSSNVPVTPISFNPSQNWIGIANSIFNSFQSNGNKGLNPEIMAQVSKILEGGLP